MKRHRMPPMRENGVNVTPLIDVVMCLIIFFMLAARIGLSTGADPSIEIPRTLKGETLNDLGNTLTLNVRAGDVIGGEPRVTTLVEGEFQPVPLRHLAGMLADRARANPQFKVIIRGEKDMAYAYLEPVLQACSEARVSSVSFNTRVEP